MNKRSVIIADIHGCLSEFAELLNQTELNKDTDDLIILGDVIDRGYDSEGVIRMIIDLKDTLGDEHVIWLKGNHEDQKIQPSKRRGLFHKETIPLSQYSRMFSQLPFIHETERCVFVHAGYDGDPENIDCILNDRTVLNGERIYNGKLYIAGHSPFYKSSTVPFDYPLYIDENGIKHDVYDGMRLPEKGAMFIDTGCVYKNKLTALILHEDGTVHLESVRFKGTD